MKYLLLPKNLLFFWYPESLVVFLRTWENALRFLEEDLAVGLMLKLLFVPLFHDSSFVGRILSFLFRSFRIALGLFAFLFVTILLLLISIVWFTLPVSAFLVTGIWGILFKGLFFSGLVLFLNHLLSHPAKKVWQIKNPTDIFLASFMGRSNLDFLKLLKTNEVKNLLLYLEQDPSAFLKFNQPLNENVVLEKVFQLGRLLKIPYLSSQHFFVAALQSLPSIENDLLKFDLTLKDFVDVLDFEVKKANFWRVIAIYDEDYKTRHLRGVNRGWLGVPTLALDAVSEDLTRYAARENIADFVGRIDIVNEVTNILSLQKGKNVLIVGEPGSGKTALVKYLAKLIIKGDAPAPLYTNRIVRIDLARLLAGIKTQGELAERVKYVFEEVKFSGQITLFVDEIQDLGMGEIGQSFNLYSLILPYLESDQFQFIATTEISNYSKILEKNSAFITLFNKIDLPPATEQETIDILKNKAIETERYQKIKTSILALKSIVSLDQRYIRSRVLPDSAVISFERSLAKAENDWVKKVVVEEVIANVAKVPVGSLSQNNSKQLLNLENIIHQKLIDQQEAVSAVSSSLRREAAHLRDQQKPIGSFLFVGPTGVGKTELAKILAEEYFQGNGNFARFDMSEYQTVESVDRLIGGLDQEGQLTEIIRNNPYSLILLDEFEKAGSKILNLFLQVLDAGRLTSGSGKLIDFTNTIIIATSNAASLTIAQGLESGKNLEEIKTIVKDELLTIFKPELINRFDEVVLFKSLSKEDLERIVRLKLLDLEKKLKEQGYIVEFEEGLVGELAEKGYDPVLGARPLRRLIQDTLESKLSVMILENKLPRGEKFIYNSSG